MRRIFGEYRNIDPTPKTLLTLKQENSAAEHKFPNPNHELMGRKPSPRFVALTAALKVARGKRDHREGEHFFRQLTNLLVLKTIFTSKIKLTHDEITKMGVKFVKNYFKPDIN